MKLPALSTIIIAAVVAVLLAVFAAVRCLMFYSNSLWAHCPF